VDKLSMMYDRITARATPDAEVEAELLKDIDLDDYPVLTDFIMDIAIDDKLDLSLFMGIDLSQQGDFVEDLLVDDDDEYQKDNDTHEHENHGVGSKEGDDIPHVALSFHFSRTDRNEILAVLNTHKNMYNLDKSSDSLISIIRGWKTWLDIEKSQ